MKAFFGYERDFSRKWKPVCYFGSKPDKSVNGIEVEFVCKHEFEVKNSDDVPMAYLISNFPPDPD